MSSLPQGWEEKELGIISLNFDNKRKPLSKKERELVNGKYRYYGAQGIIDYINDYLFDGNYILIAEDGENLRSRKESIANLVKGKFWVNNHAHIIKANQENNLHYIYYAINLLDISGYLTGTAQPKLNKANLNRMKIKIPSDINEQKRIADILSAFDDKIELNNQMNQTLEDMATTLFTESISNKKDFNETILGNLVNIKYGKDHKHLDDGIMPVYGSGGIMRYVDKFLYDKESILIPRKGTLGNLFFIQKPFWTVDTLFYTEIDTKKVIPIYLYYSLKRLNLANLNVGSAVPSLTKQALNALKLEIPNITIQKKVSDILSSYHNKILDNIEQNQTLKKQRDTILPKLMNGEIRV